MKRSEKRVKVKSIFLRGVLSLVLIISLTILASSSVKAEDGVSEVKTITELESALTSGAKDIRVIPSDVPGDYINISENWILPNGVNLTIASGARVFYNGSAGEVLTNIGTLTIEENAEFSNNRAFVNEGTITVDGAFYNQGTDGVNNRGAIVNSGFFNQLTILNNSGTFVNQGRLDSVGTITNSGYFSNSGLFNNGLLHMNERYAMTFVNTGEMVNSGEMYSVGVIDNTGALYGTGGEGATVGTSKVLGGAPRTSDESRVVFWTICFLAALVVSRKSLRRCK